jgi:hypothetical protein
VASLETERQIQHSRMAALPSLVVQRPSAIRVAESVLAHAEAKVVAAYDRSAMVERRRSVMQMWPGYLNNQISRRRASVIFFSVR